MILPVYAKINLSSGTVENYPISEQYYKDYLGGKTLAARLLHDLTPPGLDPFGEESMVIVNTAPLNGTGAPSSNRFNVSSKNVMTGGIASSNCGGTFGMMLRRAGFEGLIITGKASAPVRIEALDGEISILPAEELWGLDIEQTQERLPKHYGMLVIGPAGENRVRYAGLASGERVAGRCGCGAIFGSKQLKCITAYGTREIPVAQPEQFYKYIKKWTKFLKNHTMTGQSMPRYGSAGLVNKANSHHALPTLNFQKGEDPKADSVSGETIAETRLIRNSGCVGCVIRCERRVRMETRDIKGPEFETVGLFGPNIGNHDLDVIIRLNYVCDILGLDTISAASTIAFAMELKEKGIADFGVSFGDSSNLEDVLYKIAGREGIYDDLANGSKWMSETYGGQEYAIHSKGLELASYEPRRSVGMGLGYATSNRGGCHLNGGYTALVESIGVLSFSPQSPRGKADWTVFLQDSLEGYSAAGCCFFSGQTFIPNLFFKLGPNHIITRAVGAAGQFTGPVIRLVLRTKPILRFNTMYLAPPPPGVGFCLGIPMKFGEFVTTGERGYNLERLYNLREGLTAKEDSLPKRLTRTLQDPAKKNTVVPLEKMLPVYYRARGWGKDGVPTKKTLKRLGLEELWQG